jgi:hypothetical protein
MNCRKGAAEEYRNLYRRDWMRATIEDPETTLALAEEDRLGEGDIRIRRSDIGKFC